MTSVFVTSIVVIRFITSLLVMASDDETVAPRRGEARSEPYPASHSSSFAHIHDSNVAVAAENFKGAPLRLPWETGIAGQVMSRKPLFTLPLIGDNPMTVGKSDFLMGMALTTSSAQARLHPCCLRSQGT